MKEQICEERKQLQCPKGMIFSEKTLEISNNSKYFNQEGLRFSPKTPLPHRPALITLFCCHVLHEFAQEWMAKEEM